jgi:hypothetical protein
MTLEYVEAKSSYGRYISSIQKTGIPKEDHLFQVATALHYTPFKIARIILLGRDSGYRTEFKVKLPEEYEEGEQCMLEIHQGDSELFTKYELQWVEAREKLFELEHMLNHKRSGSDWVLDPDGEEPGRDGRIATIRDGQIIEKGYQQNGVKYECDKECSWCDYRSYCWREELKEFKNGYNIKNFKGEK